MSAAAPVIVETNLKAFQAGLEEYVRVSSKSFPQALIHQGTKFAFNLKVRLQGFAPEKGSIRRQAEAILKNGGMIRVRQAIIDRLGKQRGVSQDIKTRELRFGGKKLSETVKRRGEVITGQQLAVRAEINLRESGRKFLGFSAAYRQLDKRLSPESPTSRVQQLDRVNRFLSSAGLKIEPTTATMRFDWGGNKSSGDLARVLQRPKMRSAINAAMQDTTADMMTYIKRKHEEAAQKSANRILRG